jgi:hypothetical protein
VFVQVESSLLDDDQIWSGQIPSVMGVTVKRYSEVSTARTDNETVPVESSLTYNDDQIWSGQIPSVMDVTVKRYSEVSNARTDNESDLLLHFLIVDEIVQRGPAAATRHRKCFPEQMHCCWACT